MWEGICVDQTNVLEHIFWTMQWVLWSLKPSQEEFFDSIFCHWYLVTIWATYNALQCTLCWCNKLVKKGLGSVADLTSAWRSPFLCQCLFFLALPHPSCPSYQAPWGHKTFSSSLTTPTFHSQSVFIFQEPALLIFSIFRPYHYFKVIQFMVLWFPPHFCPWP